MNRLLLLLLSLIPLFSLSQEIKNPFILSMSKVNDSPTNYIWEWSTKQDCARCSVYFIKKGWIDFVRFNGDNSGTFTKTYPYANFASGFVTYNWEIGYITKDEQKLIHKNHGKNIFKSRKVIKLKMYHWYMERDYYLDYETYIENGNNYAYAVVYEYKDREKTFFLHKLKRLTITDADKIELNLNYNIAQKKQTYILDELKSWEKKGEFEKTTGYNIRVNSNTLSEKKQNLAKYFDDTIKEYYWKIIKRYNFKILPYNADEEFYLIQGKENRNYKFNIPIEDAKKFSVRMSKSNSFDSFSYYRDVVLLNPVIEFANNKFELKNVEFRWARNGPESNKRNPYRD